MTTAVETAAGKTEGRSFNGLKVFKSIPYSATTRSTRAALCFTVRARWRTGLLSTCRMSGPALPEAVQTTIA